MRLHPLSTLAGAAGLAALFLCASLRPAGGGLTLEQEEILSHLALRFAPDGAGGTNKTLVVTGVNVQVVNGLGHTATANGVGNLIVGYNELDDLDLHTGSHNLVAGEEHGYPTYGGLVVGFDN